ncbi:MAG: alpha/beta hydrolase [Planctomycetes bacterium]|nr:alpha/beta hydrolase [Planctomycetota bacterium]
MHAATETGQLRMPGATPGGDAVEPCPSPLTAREVVGRFEAEARRWSVQGTYGVLQGRTWGTGRPLYVLGGATASPVQFSLLAWLLREEFRVVVWEVEPQRRLRNASLAGFAADVTAAADHHADETFSVYASGFGGTVALRLLLDVPQRARAAVLHNAHAKNRLSRTERLLARMGRILPGRLKRLPFRAAIERQSHRPWFPPFDHERWSFYLDESGRTRIAALAACASLLARTDLRPRLREIGQPVLICRTEGEGPIAAAAAEELAAGLPRSRTECLHSAGHQPHLTCPHRLAKALRKFLLEEQPEGAIARDKVTR